MITTDWQESGGKWFRAGYGAIVWIRKRGDVYRVKYERRGYVTTEYDRESLEAAMSFGKDIFRRLKKQHEEPEREGE